MRIHAKQSTYCIFSTAQKLKEHAPSAIPGSFQKMRSKFRETFLEICESDILETNKRIAVKCFEEDMAEIRQRTLALYQDVEIKSEAFDCKLVSNHMEENGINDSDDNMAIDRTTSPQTSLNMEVYPEEYEFSRLQISTWQPFYRFGAET